MEHYTKQVEQHNDVGAEHCESAADHHALRLSRKLGFPIAQVRAALLANAAVKEHLG